MKFLVDAQRPIATCRYLNDAGHDALHTSELPDGNASTDGALIEVADREVRVVVTKDRDFRDGHLLNGSPRKLLAVATGNISNTALLQLFETHLGDLVQALEEADFVELTGDYLVVHERGRS